MDAPSEYACSLGTVKTLIRAAGVSPHTILPTPSLLETLRITLGARERFWGMFVVDSFLESLDRDNDNFRLFNPMKNHV